MIEDYNTNQQSYFEILGVSNERTYLNFYFPIQWRINFRKRKIKKLYIHSVNISFPINKYLYNKYLLNY